MGSRKKREMLTWYGRPYDPRNLDKKQVRETLSQIARPHVLAKLQPSHCEDNDSQLKLTSVEAETALKATNWPSGGCQRQQQECDAGEPERVSED